MQAPIYQWGTSVAAAKHPCRACTGTAIGRTATCGDEHGYANSSSSRRWCFKFSAAHGWRCSTHQRAHQQRANEAQACPKREGKDDSAIIIIMIDGSAIRGDTFSGASTYRVLPSRTDLCLRPLTQALRAWTVPQAPR